MDDKKASYLRIDSKEDRVTVASILFANGYSVQPTKQKKNGKTFTHFVKYWVGQSVMDDGEVSE